MNIDDMRYFIKVCEMRSITHAAQDSYISHQALSKRLLRIEEEMGTPLLARSASGVIPTLAGLMLYDSAQRIVRCFDDLKVEIGTAAAADKRVLRVDVAHYCGNIFDLEGVLGFEQVDPGVTISIEYKLCDECYKRILGGESDVAFANRPPNPEAFDAVDVRSDAPFVLVGTGTDLATKIEPLTLEDFDGKTLLGIEKSENMHRFLLDMFASVGSYPKLEVISYDLNSLLKLIRLGRGFHPVPASFASTIPMEGLVSRPFPAPDSMFDLQMLAKRTRKLPVVVRAFEEYICDNHIMADDGH